MAAPQKFTIHIYRPAETMDRERFLSVWRHFSAAPFAALRYDNVERVKRPFSLDECTSAYTMYEWLSVLIKGKSALASLGTSGADPVALWSLWIQPRSIESDRSRESWLAWLTDLFVLAGAYFASGALDSELSAKHSVDVEYAPGYLRTIDPGWRPHEFAGAIPGIYWLNYFGEEMTRELGGKLGQTGQLRTVDVEGKGLLALMNEPVVAVDLAARVQMQREIAQMVGADYFFDAAERDAKKRQVTSFSAAPPAT